MKYLFCLLLMSCTSTTEPKLCHWQYTKYDVYSDGIVTSIAPVDSVKTCNKLEYWQ